MPENVVAPKIDYTSRDFVAVKDDAIKGIPNFTPEWTDNNPDDFGIVLVELFSGIGDMLNWYADRLTNENFLDTAVSRISVSRLLRIIGETLRGVQSSVTTLVFSLQSIEVSDVVIPKGTRVRTSSTTSPIDFETDEEVTILAGNLQSPPVSATQGRTYNAVLGTSDGEQFQSFQITQTSILEDSIQVFVDAILWPETDSLVLIGPVDKGWQLWKTSEEELFVQFGDGINGLIPVATSSITADYRQSSGSAGNVGIGAINVVVDTFPVTVNVVNTELASGGGDPESIEAAKRRAPATFRTLGRAVSLSDYGALALNVNGVGKAKAAYGGVARINLYIAPVGGGAASQALLDDVADYMETVRMASDGITVLSATYVDVDITGTVQVLSAYRQADVEAAVLAAITSYFEVENREFGDATTPVGDVRISDVFSIIEGVAGVDFVELTVLTRVPAPVFLFASGDATFGAVTVSPTTVEETWTVVFTSPTTFTVRGSISGLQVATGTVGAAYASDNGQVVFTITAGGTPMASGDRAEFKVSQKVGSVDISETEIASEGVTNLTFNGGV